ncbi:MAG: hypothetical protein ACRDZX_18825, partial [Acidimicrobiales bacterium]
AGPGAPAQPGPAQPGPAQFTPGPGTTSQSGLAPAGVAPTTTPAGAPLGAPAGAALPGGPGPGGPAPALATVDLRTATFSAYRPLALASAWAASPATDRPRVPGARCQRGHFNHPRASTCPRCGAPVPPGASEPNVPRPSLGVLLADDGSIWQLDRGYLIGGDPASAPEVQNGSLQPLPMRPGPNHAMAQVQAEVQLRDWSVYLVDRGAEGGSCTQGPDVQGWSQLSRNEQRQLADGSHLSCGGRVLTYLAAWPV